MNEMDAGGMPMNDWVCSNCGKRAHGGNEPMQCFACNLPMTAVTAIATPADAAQAKIPVPAAASDGAFVKGLPPAPLPADTSVPNIQIDEQPTRRCAKCGSVMTMVLCEHVFINGLIASGKRMHFRCTACGKEIKLRSWGRLCLIALVCPFCFFMMFLAFYSMLSDPERAFSSFLSIVVLCFMLVLSVYPLALLSEIITRLRYKRLGGGLARSLGDFSASAAPPGIREMLFGDLPLGRWPEGSPTEFPWGAFARARVELAGGKEAAAVARWREVLAHAGLDSRHYLQAWHFLRQYGGQQPPPEVARQLLGVVVEFGGLDIVAAYADHSAQCYNFYAGGAAWERPDHSLDSAIDQLLAAGAAAVAETALWKEDGLPPPAAGLVRLSFLTPSGLHLQQGPTEALQGHALIGRVMQAATRLLLALTDKQIA
jgi:hypothetical protein